MRHLLREAAEAVEAGDAARMRGDTQKKDSTGDESTDRVLSHPFFSPGAKAKRRQTWKRLRGGAHGSG